MAFNPEKCLKFECLSQRISIRMNKNSDEYFFSLDGSEDSWETDIELRQGECAYVKGTSAPANKYFIITSSAGDEPLVALYGNIMSLIDDGAGEETVIPDVRFAFSRLFFETPITNIPEGLLPATTLARDCYNNLFCDCKQLTSIPENLLPATTLVRGCYSFMFDGCTGITTIPANLLPAEVMEEECYMGMFNNSGITEIPAQLLPSSELAYNCYAQLFCNCKNLTEIPENLLPAWELKDRCYLELFEGCTGLTTIPANLLPAPIVKLAAYEMMFFNCTGLVTLPANLLPATTIWCEAYYMMFSNCTGLTSVPDIMPRAVIDDSVPGMGAYDSMFYGCSNLREMTLNWTLWDSDEDTSYWLGDVAAEGTFYCPKELPQIFDATHIPAGWVVKPITGEKEYRFPPRSIKMPNVEIIVANPGKWVEKNE